MRRTLIGISVIVMSCSFLSCTSAGSIKTKKIDNEIMAANIEKIADTESPTVPTMATYEDKITPETLTKMVSKTADQTTLLCDSDSLYTYTDMYSDINALKSKYPDLIKVDSLGETVDGRNIAHILIGNEKASKHILIFASIHAREYITTQLTMKQCEKFLNELNSGKNYEGVSVKDLMKDTAIHFLPMTNPDGVTISQLGLEGLKKDSTKESVKKIASADGASDTSSYLRRWKSNAQGIDLNRNFDAKWDLYNDHVGHPSADHYKGTAPATTIEAQALIALTEKYPLMRTISYHTQGGVIYWYFGQTGQLKTETLNFAKAIGDLTGYKLDANYEALDPAGYKDWAISKKGIPSITIEGGSGEDPVDPSQLNDIYERNKNVWETTLYNIQE